MTKTLGVRPLAEAVASFNAWAAQDAVGQDQPPLTEDEVIAAIASWNRERFPVGDEAYAAFQTVAETRELPPGVSFTAITSWEWHDRRFTVWWVDLLLEDYNYRVRDRRLNVEWVVNQELVDLLSHGPN